MADEPYRDKLFDHEYDGIREYDNPMPAWWVWMFVLSVLFAFPYVLWYHIGNGPSILDALEAEQAAYAEKLLATYGDLSVDEPTILRMMEDENAMLAMKGLFKGKCSQCHLADGSGSVGPNLTDDHWKNVKGVVDIAEVIRTGITTKGMPAWGVHRDPAGAGQFLRGSPTEHSPRRQGARGRSDPGLARCSGGE